MMNLKRNCLFKSVAIATSIAIGGSHSSVNRNNIISALKLRAAEVVDESSVTTTQSLSNNASSEKPISSEEEDMIVKLLTWEGVQKSRIDTIEQIAAFENFGSNQWHKYFNHKKMKADGVTVADKNEKTVVEKFQIEFADEYTTALQDSFLRHTKRTTGEDGGIIPDIGSNMNQYYYSNVVGKSTKIDRVLENGIAEKEKNQELFNGNILPKMLTSTAVETLYQFSKQESAWSESVPFGSRMKPSEKLIKEEIRKEFDRERSAKKEREDFLDEAKQLKALWGEVSREKSIEIFRKSTSASELKIISEIDEKIDRIDTVYPSIHKFAGKMDVSSIEKLHQKYLEPLVYAIITAVADAAKRGEDEASFITTENVGLALYKIVDEEFPHIRMMMEDDETHQDDQDDGNVERKQYLRASYVLQRYIEELRDLQQPNFSLENTVTIRQNSLGSKTTFPIEERSEPYHDDGISNTPTNVWFSRLGSRTVTTPVGNKVATEEDTTMSNSGSTSSTLSDDATIERLAFAFSPISDPEKTIIKRHNLNNLRFEGHHFYDAWQYAYNYISKELHARGFSFSLDVIHNPTLTFYHTDSKKPAIGVSSNSKTDSEKTPTNASAGGGVSAYENESGFTGNVFDAADRFFDAVYYKLSVKTHKDAKIKNEDILGNLFGFMRFPPDLANKRWESVGELKGFVTKDEYERYLKAGIKKGYSEIDDITTILELPNPNSTNDFIINEHALNRAIEGAPTFTGLSFEERSAEQKSLLLSIFTLHNHLLNL